MTSISFQRVFMTIAIVSCLGMTVSGQWNFYRGNIHAHSDYSDGNANFLRNIDTPMESYLYAMMSDSFDFLGISEHNHSEAKRKDGGGDTISINRDFYHRGLLEADQSTIDNQFVAFYGLEWGVSTNGHVILYGVDSLISWEEDNNEVFNQKEDYESLFNYVGNIDGSFVYLAHPSKKDYGNLLSKPYSSLKDSLIVGVALRSGPAFSRDTNYQAKPSKSYRSYYFKLLGRGYHVGPGCDHDNHYTNFGRSTQTRLTVLAKDLSRDSIFDAIRKQRFYASDDWNTEVKFTCNSMDMGTVSTGTSNPIISIQISDAEDESVDKIRLYRGISGNRKNPKLLETYRDTEVIMDTISQRRNSRYYYLAEIHQVDGDRIWTAPIWYTKQ